MNKQYYSETYIPSIIKWGKLTLLLGILTSFLPALVISFVFGHMPPVSAIIAGTISQISDTVDALFKRRGVLCGGAYFLFSDSWNPGNVPYFPVRKYVEYACSMFIRSPGGSRSGDGDR